MPQRKRSADMPAPQAASALAKRPRTADEGVAEQLRAFAARLVGQRLQLPASAVGLPSCSSGPERAVCVLVLRCDAAGDAATIVLPSGEHMWCSLGWLWQHVTRGGGVTASALAPNAAGNHLLAYPNGLPQAHEQANVQSQSSQAQQRRGRWHVLVH